MQEVLSKEVKKKAYELGYDLCGIIKANSFKEYIDYLNIRKGLDKVFGKVYLFDGRLSYSEEYSCAVLFEEYLKGQGMKTYKDGVTARWAAVKAGLGRFGKNNFVYTKFGAWV